MIKMSASRRNRRTKRNRTTIIKATSSNSRASSLFPRIQNEPLVPLRTLSLSIPHPLCLDHLFLSTPLLSSYPFSLSLCRRPDATASRVGAAWSRFPAAFQLGAPLLVASSHYPAIRGWFNHSATSPCAANWHGWQLLHADCRWFWVCPPPWLRTSSRTIPTATKVRETWTLLGEFAQLWQTRKVKIK